MLQAQSGYILKTQCRCLPRFHRRCGPIVCHGQQLGASYSNHNKAHPSLQVHIYRRAKRAGLKRIPESVRLIPSIRDSVLIVCLAQIRYHLQHGLTPRPLRFSRNRALRHWTIHRAWQRLQDVRRKAQDFELERQYNAMRDACEALRLIDDSGMTKEEAEKIGATRKGGVMGQKGNEEGRLYRIAMMKEEIWDGVPIEYARLQVETPGREGWNHGWTR